MFSMSSQFGDKKQISKCSLLVVLALLISLAVPTQSHSYRLKRGLVSTDLQLSRTAYTLKSRSIGHAFLGEKSAPSCIVEKLRGGADVVDEEYDVSKK